MGSYAAHANKAVRRFARTPEGRHFISAVSAIVGDAADLMIQTRKRTHDMANDGTKFLKNESARTLRRYSGLVERKMDTKSLVCAAGIGAALAYFLIPRK